MKLTEPNPELAKLEAQTVPGQAHWGGSGPPGRTCGECQHWVSYLRRGMRCDQYYRMMRRWHQERLPASALACRHFLERPKT